MSKVYFNGGIA